VTAVQNVVDGKRVDAADGRTTELVDPTTGTAYGTAPLSAAGDVAAATAAAARAFEQWRWTTPSERQLALLRIADAVAARAEELVAAESRNTGKPLALTASEEVPPMVDQLRFFAGAARLLEGRSAGEYLAGHTSYVRREPIGVCAQVTPWNYPMMMAVWKFAPAIAAGNTVVLKPSDTTPVTTALLAELAAEFLPPGRAQRHLRRPRHGGGAGRRRGAGDGVDHRFGPGRHAGRAGRVAAAQAAAPRARRQGAGGHLRRRRRPGGGRGDRDGRLL